jgi:glyoxylase-like metal-dependent hydrolase (beta-lactamase superfamily II)
MIRTIVSRPFDENSYLVRLSGRSEAFVVDPGFEPEAIIDAVHEEHVQVVAILNTHGHVDHIAGNAAMKTAFPDAPLVIGAGDAEMLTDANLNMSAPFGIPVTSPPADRLVRESDRISFGGVELTVHEIPGHSPGHVVYVWHGTPPIVIGGDILFREGIGRWDFPGGSFEMLRAGIVGKLWVLPDATIVYPGHGPVTTVGHEKRHNPYVRG